MQSFSQRLAARCYLESLNRDETIAYVRAQIAAVGGDPQRIFCDGALQSIHRATDGIPRLINQVCDHALLLASIAGCQSLDAAAIETAWADLQQLPAPWSGEQSNKSSASEVVEFGGLDSLSDEPPDAIPIRSTAPQFSAAAAGGDAPSLDQQAADLDEDFEPAGSIGPPLELSFDSEGDPFGGPYAEEEIVLDRYASLEADLFGRRPLVSSREGRELSALLTPFDRNTPSARVIAAQSVESEAANDPVLPDEQVVDVVEPDDADLIVIEDEPQGAGAAACRGGPLVRRQEYRQLFSRLRRG
jgi:hypothetical protein